MATADLTVIGLGRDDPSASHYIAEIQRRLAAQDRVGYRLHAMGTSLEGETRDILEVVGELHAVPFELGLPRVYTVLKLDERRDRAQTLEDKVASVERLLDEGPSHEGRVAHPAVAE
ncbi:MAG TPA: MTH1187 family thiamine-binding protein [Solirubrobacteraceae bacterium]|nr:MTH1187 family thiamine-binding protein [Solirubrobacteraceae bacterium]